MGPSRRPLLRQETTPLGDLLRAGAGAALAVALSCSSPPTQPGPASPAGPVSGAPSELASRSGEGAAGAEPEPVPEARAEADPALSEGDSAQAGEGEVEEDADPLALLLSNTPRCDAAPSHCFGVHLHIVVGEDGLPVQELQWITDQLAGAQDRFATAADATFEVIAVDALADEHRDIVSRLDRDKLGRPHFSRGVVHVFVVGSLANVDEPGVIRGVHWRDRQNTARRWVILSSIAGSMTLTHELGHFFSLPHSRYEGSLMNKRPGGPPFSERGFHPREAARMRKAKAAMIADKMLVVRSKAPAVGTDSQ